MSSRYDRLGAEEVANLKITTVSGSDGCCTGRHRRRTSPAHGCARGLDVTSRPRCSSFRVIVVGLSLGDVVDVGVGKQEVEDKSERE